MTKDSAETLSLADDIYIEVWPSSGSAYGELYDLRSKVSLGGT